MKVEIKLQSRSCSALSGEKLLATPPLQGVVDPSFALRFPDLIPDLKRPALRFDISLTR
jgi:hypothetical protein